jgi:hypothetical protein
VIRRCPAPLTVLVAALGFGLGSLPMSTQADGITAGTAEYTLTATTALPTPTVPVPGAVFSLTGTVTSGSSTVAVSSTSQLAIGDPVSGTGIPSGAAISQINANGTGFTLSQNATASGSESLTLTSVPSPQIFAIINPAGGVVTPATTSTQGPVTFPAGFNTNGVYDYLAASTTSSGQPVQALGLSFYGGLTAGTSLNFFLNVANASAPPQLGSQTAGVTITLDSPGSTTSSSSSSSSSSSTSSSSSSSTGTVDSVPEPLSVLLWATLAAAGLLRVRVMRQAGRVSSDD